MTPEDYKTIRENLTNIIDTATQQREDAYREAEKCEPPVKDLPEMDLGPRTGRRGS